MLEIGMPKVVNAPIIAAVAANLGVAVAKFVASYFTGSAVMRAEGIHSLVDSGNELFLIMGRWRTQKRADVLHPFGYGREIYFWTLLVGIMIFAVGGAFSLYQGINHIFHPAKLEKAYWNLIVLAIALLLESSSLRVGITNYRQRRPFIKILGGLRGNDDPTTFAIIMEDLAAISGLTIAF